jgi:hypothetical protein
VLAISPVRPSDHQAADLPPLLPGSGRHQRTMSKLYSEHPPLRTGPRSKPILLGAFGVWMVGGFFTTEGGRMAHHGAAIRRRTSRCDHGLWLVKRRAKRAPDRGPAICL